MSDEFGEDPSIYVWPKGHEDGTPFPEDFWSRLREVLDAGGFEMETC